MSSRILNEMRDVLRRRHYPTFGSWKTTKHAKSAKGPMNMGVLRMMHLVGAFTHRVITPRVTDRLKCTDSIAPFSCLSRIS